MPDPLRAKLVSESASGHGQGFDLPSWSDPELRPLCMRDMLRNARFFGFFENLGNHVFDASS